MKFHRFATNLLPACYQLATRQRWTFSYGPATFDFSRLIGIFTMDKISFAGSITAVKARIRLIRSFDQTPTHQYQGYNLLLEGKLADVEQIDVTVDED